MEVFITIYILLGLIVIGIAVKNVPPPQGVDSGILGFTVLCFLAVWPLAILYGVLSLIGRLVKEIT